MASPAGINTLPKHQPGPTKYVAREMKVNVSSNFLGVPKTNNNPHRALKSHEYAIADTGATGIFVMEGSKVANKRLATKPLVINLPDGTKVKSTHECDITIPGLPTILTGHIVPKLSIASLIGIRVLCEAGCKVVFSKRYCDVIYNNKIIVRGYKDASTDLWTLPLTTTPSPQLPTPTPQPPTLDVQNVVSFTHSIKTRANNVKFTHQSLCNPKISKLIKAIRRGFLKGCPHLSEELVLKYLNPSPATAKGCMKKPRHGIKSTTPKKKHSIQEQVDTIVPPIIPPIPQEQIRHLNLIPDDSDASVANVFCFGIFADKNSGVVYNDMTGNFPFVSIDGCVCYFIMYHYESNAILATPIDGMTDIIIFNAYKKNYDMLVKKGFKVKLNVMDNQATKHIKKFLDEEDCKLLLVEPGNKRLNASERAIQTWKDAIIAALATTDSDFPLQLWDRLTPQVQDCLNLMRASRINPSISAYEALNGLYDWNRYPLAPLGCKAVIYEDASTRNSWAPRGVDGWYLGPSKDHYRCHLFYIPETRAYRISGSAELFPQHCQLPNLTPLQHLRALTQEITNKTEIAAQTPQGRTLLHQLQTNLTNIINPTATQTEEQRVRSEEQRVRLMEQEQQQRVIDDTPILTIPRITNAEPIMQSRNPTAKRNLKKTPRIHRRQTPNNTPGAVPPITRIVDDNPHGFPPYEPNKVAYEHDLADPILAFSMIQPPPTPLTPFKCNARNQIVSIQAINALTMLMYAIKNIHATSIGIMSHCSAHPKFETLCKPNGTPSHR